MPNRSLDDFAGGEEEETEADASDVETDDAEAEIDGETEGADEPTLTVEEATPTYDFSPDGATCEACGETVETRWHAAEVGMVCPDCKGW